MTVHQTEEARLLVRRFVFGEPFMLPKICRTGSALIVRLAALSSGNDVEERK